MSTTVTATVIDPPILQGDHLFTAPWGDGLLVGTLPLSWQRDKARRRQAGLRRKWSDPAARDRLTAPLPVDGEPVADGEGPDYLAIFERPAFVAPEGVFTTATRHGEAPEMDAALHDWYRHAWSVTNLGFLIQECADLLVAMKIKGHETTTRFQEVNLEANQARMDSMHSKAALAHVVNKAQALADSAPATAGQGQA